MKFFESEGFKRYFSNTSWLFVERIARTLSSLVVGIYVVRYLGPERYGLLSFSQSFVGLFMVLANLGLDNIVIRDLVQFKNKRKKILGTAFSLKLVGSFILLLIITLSLPLFSDSTLENVIILIITTGVIFNTFGVIDFYFQAVVKSKHVVQAKLVAIIFSSVLRIFLITIKASLIWFAVSILLEQFIIAIFLSINYYKQGQSIFDWQFDKNIAFYLVRSSWPLILTGIFVSIYMKIDQVMIKEMLDEEANGLYAAAVKLSEAWYFLPSAICSSFFPAILNAKKKSNKLYYNRLQRLYDAMFWSAVLIAIPVTFLSGWIIDILFGSSYAEASNVLSIHIWTGIFVFLGIASGKWLIAEDYTKKYFYRTMWGAIVNVILNFILIPYSGIIGAAVATLAAQAIAGFFYDILDKDTRATFKMKCKSILPLKRWSARL